MQVWHLVVLHVWSLTCFVLYVLFLKITASVSIDTALSPVRSTSCAYVQHVSRFKSFLGNIATITNPFLCSESSPLRHGFHMNEIIGCQWQWASGIVHFHLRIWGVRMRMCGFWSEKNQYESMEVSCLYCFQTSASCENQAVGCGRLFVSEKECGSGWRTHAGDGRRHRDPKGSCRFGALQRRGTDSTTSKPQSNWRFLKFACGWNFHEGLHLSGSPQRSNLNLHRCNKKQVLARISQNRLWKKLCCILFFLFSHANLCKKQDRYVCSAAGSTLFHLR